MKRREDNIKEWTGLEFAKSQGAVKNREKWRKLGTRHRWCPNDPRGQRIGEGESDSDVFCPLDRTCFEMVRSHKFRLLSFYSGKATRISHK